MIPTLLNAGDPCSQDEALFTAGSLDNCRRYGGGITDPLRWEHEERRFHQSMLGVLAGIRSWDDADLLDSARLLGIDGPRHHDARPGRLADAVVNDELLCDVVEDAVPELMMLLERVTGVEGMPARPPIGAVAVLGFIHCGIEGTRPIDGWMDDETDRALVQAVRVIDDAPMSLWSQSAAPELGRSFLPVVPSLRPCPDDAVWASLPEAFLGRPYRVSAPSGPRWAFSCVVPVTTRQARRHVASALTRRLTLELWDLRRTERRSTFEDVLRHRPEVVCRSALEME
ncbi:MAG: hypothetical protein EXR69_04675 [Myxococcales bacterium]|nr:hypothetical protein [Myxococcales bacterium]